MLRTVLLILEAKFMVYSQVFCQANPLKLIKDDCKLRKKVKYSSRRMMSRALGKHLCLVNGHG